ncbi:MAG: hypothetical protein O7E52_24035, partial [Candidatus Poribacteria bacterium]|nr:hypothetical protein [Candidatus Poribacteria bacterium]
MSDQTVTLELPKTLWEWAQRTATVTRRSVENVLVDSLAATIPPPLDDVPEIFREELALLETKNDEDLWAITRLCISPKHIRQYDGLLEKNRIGTLTAQEQRKLEQMRKDAERIMLMRARAFVLLQWRGYRLPTVDELEKGYPF